MPPCEHNFPALLNFPKLTLADLQKMEPNTIFAMGCGKRQHPWFNNAKNIDENRDTIVHWVAARGCIHDWAIYHSMDANLEPAPYFDGDTHLHASPERVAQHGAKEHNL